MSNERHNGLFAINSSLILASASPRRKDFLEQLGISFEIVIPAVQEVVLQGEEPVAFVKRIAAEKARSVADVRGDVWVLSADTVVVQAKMILGKPLDNRAAVEMLMSLSGQRHKVLTGFCLCHAGKGVEKTLAVSTDVTFADFPEEIARAYVNTGEPLDKAGSYGIQGIGGVLVEKINGSYSNVVGLPMAEVVGTLLSYEVITTHSEQLAQNK